MCYTGTIKEKRCVMEDRLVDFYRVPNIEEYEDVHLMTLREECLAMEEKLEEVKDGMSWSDREILECYLDMRNELEFQSVKAALRWGKRHYK